MRMGSVREVKVTFDPATTSFDIPVMIELDPAPFATDKPTEEAAGRVYDVISAMVRRGLRAELVSANLVLGSLAVALEMQPEAPPAELGQGLGGLREIPTTGLPFVSPTAQVEHVIARISALPLERVVDELENLIAAVRRIADDPALPRLLADTASTSDALVPAARQLDPTLRAVTALAVEARTSLAELRVLLDQSRALPQQIDRVLVELTSAARSMRLLTEMLERQPEAILRGKGG
jgi:paraquat-inducible protein B